MRVHVWDLGALTEEEAEQLRAWYVDDGLTIYDLAERLGLYPSTVRERLVAAGVPIRRPGVRSRVSAET